MATRQEIMAGYTLAKTTHRVNLNLWGALSVLQDKSPRTGLQLVWVDEAGIEEDRPWTVEELEQSVRTVLGTLNNNAYMVQQFLNKASRVLVRKGLEYFNVVRDSHVEADIESATNKRVVLVTALDGMTLPDKVQFENIALVQTYNPALPATVETDQLPEWMKWANSGNDILDAMSYELQGLCSYQGTGKVLDLDVLKNTIKSRCRVGVIETSQAYGKPDVDTSDVDGIINLINYVSTEVDDCVTRTDYEQLGQYIDANMEKLPLVRRHWAL